MKNIRNAFGFAIALAILALGSLGCSMLKAAAGNNTVSNVNIGPSPTPVPSASVAPTSDNAAAAFHDQKNLLAFASGTRFVNDPHEYYKGASNWTALAMIDELVEHGWAKRITDGGVGETMVLEMSERATLKNFVIDTDQTENNSSAKNFTIEISDTSATDGFTKVVDGQLKDHLDGQVFKVSSEVPGRWVRLTIKDNYGSDQYTEIMELRGYGDQLTNSVLDNVSGTYKMEQYGNMHIKQDGTSVIGCYEYNSGIIEGGVEGKVMRLTWTEGDDKKHGGPALMIFSSDGKTMHGAWGNSESKGYTDVWNGQKISNDVGTCPQLPQLGKVNAAKETIGSELKEKGRAAVYGINFDFNSDTIRNESRSTLDQIVALLKENKDWKMLIEGHTDNIGGADYNKTLSEKRAASVKAYLVAAGIDESRLSSAGLGLTNPIAPNDTEFGRAQNRRVELVKQ